MVCADHLNKFSVGWIAMLTPPRDGSMNLYLEKIH